MHRALCGALLSASLLARASATASTCRGCTGSTARVAWNAGIAGYNAGRLSAYGTLGGGLNSLGYYNPGYYGTTYIPGAYGGLCANGGVYMNGMCLPPTQEYIYGGVGAVQPVQYVQTQVPVPVPVPVPVTAAAATATTAVAGAAGVTATPRPRRHLSSGINAPAPAPAAAPQAQPAASSVLAATNLPPPRCPVSASDGRKFLRVVDDIAAACSRPPQHGAPKAEQERFCQECVAPTQAALVTAMLSAISANVTTPAAAADPAVQVACGEAAARALADAGAPVDDAFLEATAACAGFAARRECPLTSLERRMAPLLAACDLALTTAERGAMAPPGGKKGPAVVGEAEAGAFCADCYWPVFGLIMNEGNLSDTYWCAARNVVLAAQQATAAGATSAGSAPEAAALAALYDPRVAPRFTACLANVQGVAARRAATVTSARDPFASPLARAVSQRCWRRDALLRGTNGLSLVRPELKTRLVALSCPGQDKGDKPILNLEAAKTAGG